MTPLCVAHVITGLERGGAETALQRLLDALDPAEVASSVTSLTVDGAVGVELRERGVETTVLGLGGPLRTGPAVGRLVGNLRRSRPDVVQTWMYHADLVGGLAARAARTPVVVWGIRQGDLDARTTTARTRAVARTCALLSHVVPDAIVCASTSAADAHRAVGYAADRMAVIPNGVPIPEHDPAARSRLRHELGLFVVAVAPTGCSFSNKLLALWDEADRILAKRSTWLFWTTTAACRWSALTR